MPENKVYGFMLKNVVSLAPSMFFYEGEIYLAFRTEKNCKLSKNCFNLSQGTTIEKNQFSKLRTWISHDFRSGKTSMIPL